MKSTESCRNRAGIVGILWESFRNLWESLLGIVVIPVIAGISSGVIYPSNAMTLTSSASLTSIYYDQIKLTLGLSYRFITVFSVSSLSLLSVSYLSRFNHHLSGKRSLVSYLSSYLNRQVWGRIIWFEKLTMFINRRAKAFTKADSPKWLIHQGGAIIVIEFNQLK